MSGDIFLVLQLSMIFQDIAEKKGHALSEWIYLGGVKAFADGSLGSNSALFHEPHADEPTNYVLQVSDLVVLANATMASERHRLQAAIQAIGDRANGMILDMYELVISENAKGDRRFRIEHAQHLSPGALVRFSKLGVIALVQPLHLLDDAASAAKRVGNNRAETGSYLFWSLTNKAELAWDPTGQLPILIIWEPSRLQ